jgi:hypothetical protein
MKTINCELDILIRNEWLKGKYSNPTFPVFMIAERFIKANPVKGKEPGIEKKTVARDREMRLPSADQFS